MVKCFLQQWLIFIIIIHVLQCETDKNKVSFPTVSCHKCERCHLCFNILQQVRSILYLIYTQQRTKKKSKTKCEMVEVAQQQILVTNIRAHQCQWIMYLKLLQSYFCQHLLWRLKVKFASRVTIIVVSICCLWAVLELLKEDLDIKIHDIYFPTVKTNRHLNGY